VALPVISDTYNINLNSNNNNNNSVSKLAYNPNKIDLTSWTGPQQPQQQQQQAQQQDFEMSKDGIQNLKARFYAPPGGHSQQYVQQQQQQQQQPLQQQPKTRLVSQENYLFNGKTARQFSDHGDNDNGSDFNNGFNGSNSAFTGYNDQIASSDL
jgi:hypothetical protein